MRIKNKDYIHLRIEDELKEKLKKEANMKGLSLNSYIRMILIERNK